LSVAEAGKQRFLVEDHRGVGGEYQIGETFDGFEEGSLCAGIDDICAQRVPLPYVDTPYTWRCGNFPDFT